MNFSHSPDLVGTADSFGLKRGVSTPRNFFKSKK
jgi:hypothetical protein